jgi:hypothetical protein
MSLEILEAKVALRELVDTFANLADEKRIADQMPLFTPDTKVQVYMGDTLLFDISGTRQLEETFNGFTANVTRSYHMNGQQLVEIDGDSARGIAHCQVKLVSEEEGREVLTDVRREGRWLITKRIPHFTVNDKRPLQG